VKRALLVVAVAIFVTGCGGDGGGESKSPYKGTPTTPAETVELRVYWLRDGKVWPALREVAETEAVATAALEQLLAGPTEQEQLTSASRPPSQQTSKASRSPTGSHDRTA